MNPRRPNLVGEDFYLYIRRVRPRYEYRVCRRCGKENAHLAGRKICVTCRENRPRHKHRSKYGHNKKRTRRW